MKRLIMIITFLILIFITSIYLFMQQPKFGKLPKGERLERIKASPNYKNGSFKNLEHTPSLAEGYSYWGVMKEFFFKKKVRQKPDYLIPTEKINLHNINPNENLMVWFGHSSYFLQVDGKKILIDPVLSGAASPIPITTKAFKGTDVYTYNDIPEIDYLFITHDHWDHLDYETIKAIQNKIKKVICGLGVGAHLEHWGISAETITETDWNNCVILDKGFISTTTPARHFSGRGFKRDQTLWVSYALETPSFKLFFGGDGGYGNHFAEIGKQFGEFDLALLENGQYDLAWRYIHLLPNQVIRAANDLNAKIVLPGHSSKFDLANHEWDSPLKTITNLHTEESFKLITPLIGEKVNIDNQKQYIKWWEEMNEELNETANAATQ